mmetsp:Transcript_28837/g.63463  ORF Transcript_28837/g.63463 Transcript_28837/m.63463 type:complete len:217 (+) Transcript_28837:23-673(+)
MRRDVLESKIALNAKNIEIDKARKEFLMRKVFEQNEELRELEQKLKMAKVNKDRRNQLEEKRELESQELVADFQEDVKLMEKLNEETQNEQVKQLNEKKRLFENEKVVRDQIIDKERELAEIAERERLRDKDQVDEIVERILHEERSGKDRLAQSKRQQFNNMVDSLWLKNQNIKREKQLEAEEWQRVINFQKILDQRETQKLEKQQAANEFKDKV